MLFDELQKGMGRGTCFGICIPQRHYKICARRYDEQHAIGRRYARHDEVGTPYCLTVDGQTAQDDTVTIRYRDSRRQERIPVREALQVVQDALANSEQSSAV